MINVPKVALGFILALYAIVKPYDNADLELTAEPHNGFVYVKGQNIINGIEGMFFENNSRGSNAFSKETPLLPTYSRKNTEHEDYVNEFKVFIKDKHPSIANLGSFKETTSKYKLGLIFLMPIF